MTRPNAGIVISSAVLLAIAVYFIVQFRSLSDRSSAVARVEQTADAAGPCRALEQARTLSAQTTDPDVQYSLDAQRRHLAIDVVGDNPDLVFAFVNADDEGLIPPAVCEAMRLTQHDGRPHPTATLLQFTHGTADFCSQEALLENALEASGTHASLFVPALMRRIESVECLSSITAHLVAERTAALLRADPQIADGFHSDAVIAFLMQWAAPSIIRTSCLLDARDVSSELRLKVPCNDDNLQLLGTHRYPMELPSRHSGPGLPAQSEVVILDQQNARCTIRPATGPPRLFRVACSDLVPSSPLLIGVHADDFDWRGQRLHLIAGLARYEPVTQDLKPTRGHPGPTRWFSYHADGRPLGRSDSVAMAIHPIPDDPLSDPLRATCRAVGARYCYDVDWTQAVTWRADEPQLFLSHPNITPLRATPLDTSLRRRFQEAFGPELDPHGALAYGVPATGGVVLTKPMGDRIHMAWRPHAEAPWNITEVVEAGRRSRVLAVLDVDANGQPECIIEHSVDADENQRAGGTDEIEMLTLSPQGKTRVNRLVIHEY